MVATNSQSADELAAPLDLLLTSSAIGMADRLMPNVAWSRFALNLAKQPRIVASRAASLGRELLSIAEGRSEVAPAKGDKRFADPAWRGNPLLHRTMQAYLATNGTVDQLFSDANLDWRDAERIRFVLDFLSEGLSPSNNPVLNPLGWKALIDTGGRSAVRGLRHFVSDMASAPRVPSMVEPDAFTLGKTIAVTPGSVVFRCEEFELIQYAPQTEKVFSAPLLMVPPVINKFYIMDISPGRSMIEYFLREGIQVFAISWRNPTAEQRNWGFDAYGQAILNALDAVEKITQSDRTHLQASCSGGILAAMTAAHLNATGEGQRLAGLTLMVTVLDQTKAGFAAAAIDEEAANIAIALSQRKGYLDGRSLAEVFAWLRPTDLVWRYWVNNYVEGKSPAAFDVLYWNADTTRMAAALHRDMVTMGLHNSLATPGAVSMLGTPGGPQPVDHRCLRGGGDRRPHIAVAGLLSQCPAARYQESALCALVQRTHRVAGQPAGQPQGELPRRRCGRARSGVLAGVGRAAHGLLVARLRLLVRRPQRREEGRTTIARRRRYGATGAGSRFLRARTLNIERGCMTTVLEEPADLLKLVGQRLGTTDWIQITQDQVDRFADATGDKQWIHTDPQRAAKGPYKGTIAHGYLTLSLAPVVISQVLQIRELTAALNYGLNKVRFPMPLPVGSQVRAAVTVMSAQQKTSGVESVFTLTYEIDGEDRPACVADVIVLYP